MSLPLTQTDSPSNAAEVASIVRDSVQSSSAVYPLGGETALDYGLRARVPGHGISLKKLNRVIDYPARDMTITVEAGMTIAELQKVLAAENQELPIDVPQSESATIGGALVTNMNGPRRWGLGTWRDYVIGIEAVDGLGRIYHAGGRVVKNVAGYDFCRLLVGSCGTQGIVTQVTLKLKPKSETHSAIGVQIYKTEQIEPILAQLSRSAAQLSAVEFMMGPRLQEARSVSSLAEDSLSSLNIFFEGTTQEVRWMQDTLLTEILNASSSWNKEYPMILDPGESAKLFNFSTNSLGLSAERRKELGNLLSLKCVIPSSRLTEWIDSLRTIDPTCSIHAHSLSGIVYSHHSNEPKSGLTKWLLDNVHPRARELGGYAQVWNFPNQTELTGPTAWGTMGDAGRMLTEIRKQFDPQSVLNPGRFW